MAALNDKNEGVRNTAAAALWRIGDPRAIPALAAALGRTEGGVYNALMTFGPRVCDSVAAGITVPASRTAALRVLAVFHDPRAFEPLLLDLREEETCDEASISLGLLGDQRAVPALLALLEQPSVFGHYAQYEALGNLKAVEAVPYLLQAMKSDESWIRVVACETLGKIGDPRAVESLQQMLAAATDEREQAAVVHALAAIRDARVVPILAGALKTNTAASEMAAGVLGKIGSEEALDVLINALHQGDPTLRPWIIQALAYSDQPRVIEALRQVMQHDKERRYRLEAARVLGRTLPDEAAPVVIDILAGEFAEELIWEERWFEHLLSQVTDPRTADRLLQMLNGDDARAYPVAALGLGILKDRRAVPRLTQLAETAQSVHARSSAIRALGEIGDGRAVPVLLACLRDDPPGDSEPWLPRYAAWALGQCRDPRAVVPLICCLEHGYVAEQAAESLGMIGDQRAVAPLQQAMRTSKTTPIAVAGALAAFGDTDAVTHLLAVVTSDSQGDRRAAAIRALGQVNDARVNAALIHALTDRDSFVRVTVAQVLEMRQAQEAVPALINALTDDFDQVRHTAAAALTAITHQDYGTDSARWRAWWETQGK